ncbi:MAG TPA: hypothetical protein PKN87_09750 [Syntrophomonadaceae bacterium]|nr:hypothetical protein [Syntrophomonadaceae bacterium]HPR94277.1 hypothetical protein [Syntrophomonadaceae bacterium]
MQNKSKWLTIFFSFVPGAGHMYLGLINTGIRLMTVFFLTLFLMGWLGISFIGFVLPVLWCYSVFSAYNLYQSGETEDIDMAAIFPVKVDHAKWIGWGLIIFGIIVIAERILLPHISWEIQGYLRTGVVAILFILGGIYLLRGEKTESLKSGEEEDSCEHGGQEH